METFLIEVANDAKPARVGAASWICSNDYELSSFDDEGKLIDTWKQHEWYRVVGENERGKYVDIHVNPHVPNPKPH